MLRLLSVVHPGKLWVRLARTKRDKKAQDKEDAAPQKAEATSPTVTQANNAVDHLRTTAKWIITLFAALAVVLLAGTQVSSLGKLDAPHWMPENRLTDAFVAGGLALAAVGVVIWAALQVLLATPIQLVKAAQDESEDKITDDVVFIRSLGLIAPQVTLADFIATGPRLEAERQAARRRSRAERVTPDAKATAEAEVKRANDQIAYFAYTLLDVQAMLRYESARRAMGRAKTFMLAAGFVGGVAIGAFTWAANPPPPPNVPKPFAVPVRAIAQLSDANKKKWAEDLGKECINGRFEVIVLSADDKTATIVSLPGEKCAVTQLDVTRDEIHPVEMVATPDE